jgi:hypothetical protein
MLVAVNINFGYPSSLVRYISPEFNLPIMRRGRVKEFSKLKKEVKCMVRGRAQSNLGMLIQLVPLIAIYDRVLSYC